GLGDVFDELLVQLPDLFGLRAGGGRFSELAALVRGVSDDLAANHIEQLVETGTGIDGQAQRKYARAIMLAHLGQRFLKIRLLLVERVDDDEFWDVELRGVFPD